MINSLQKVVTDIEKRTGEKPKDLHLCSSCWDIIQDEVNRKAKVKRGVVKLFGLPIVRFQGCIIHGTKPGDTQEAADYFGGKGLL